MAGLQLEDKQKSVSIFLSAPLPSQITVWVCESWGEDKVK